MDRTLEKISGYEELIDLMQKAGIWFIGSFMIEFLKCYESKLRDKVIKREYIKNFCKQYSSCEDIDQTRNKINVAIRIIESGMVIKAMEVVLATNDKKVGCDESKYNAQYVLDKINSGEIMLPACK